MSTVADIIMPTDVGAQTLKLPRVPQGRDRGVRSVAAARAAAMAEFVSREREWVDRASRSLEAELKRAGIGYEELAERLNAHGLEETETSITGKLARGISRPRSSWRV
jgi:Domain of unknown function (DUF6471)